MTQIWIGTSGWIYPHWREILYPRGLAQARWLEHYARHFSTVEINASFYHLPSAETFRQWAASVPEGFRFAVKANRYLTHMKKLKDADVALARFIERARLLGDKLGPLLYQLPPRWRCNLERLEAFLRLLPCDLSHVFEFRDPSWMNEDVFALLRAYQVSFCVFSHPSLHCPLVITADPIYVRMHGGVTLYSSAYTEEELQEWATKLREQHQKGHEIYVYFNNDTFGYAVQNAQRLRELCAC